MVVVEWGCVVVECGCVVVECGCVVLGDVVGGSVGGGT